MRMTIGSKTYRCSRLSVQGYDAGGSLRADPASRALAADDRGMRVSSRPVARPLVGREVLDKGAQKVWAAEQNALCLNGALATQTFS